MCVQLLAIASILLLIQFSNSFRFFHRNLLASKIYETGNNPDLEAFLKGEGTKSWRGTRDILKRRGQVPLPSYTPQDVCKICLKALQNNDDPQLVRIKIIISLVRFHFIIFYIFKQILGPWRMCCIVSAMTLTY